MKTEGNIENELFTFERFIGRSKLSVFKIFSNQNKSYCKTNVCVCKFPTMTNTAWN